MTMPFLEVANADVDGLVDVDLPSCVDAFPTAFDFDSSHSIRHRLSACLAGIPCCFSFSNFL